MPAFPAGSRPAYASRVTPRRRDDQPTADTARLPSRRVRFEFPDDLNPAWNPRVPEFAFAANGISLLMPYAEPYFVKTVESALPDIDAELAPRVEDFLRQERQHHGQHRRFNDLIGARYGGITRLEGWIGRTYGWLSRTRSLRFNLAFAAGSETIAFAIARWSDAHYRQVFSGADPVPTTLFLWHLAEEVEHKSVAFDVWEAIDGSHLRYALASAISLCILTWFVWLSSLVMLAGEGRLFYPVAHIRLIRYSVSLGMTVLPTLAVSAMPGHHPSSFADPPLLPSWLAGFDPETGTMPLWEP
jgi:predicted metal-dependent hydrolase